MPDQQIAASGMAPESSVAIPEASSGSALQRVGIAARRFGGPIVVLLFQVLGVLTVTFFLVHLTPGDPASLLAGPYPTEESLAIIRARLGLDRPLWEQYFIYIAGVAQGDLGMSTMTGSPVVEDLARKIPATFGLITVTLLVSGVLTLLLTWAMVAWPKNVVGKIIKGYTVAGAALPDFWTALCLSFVFYFTLGIAPAPSGQIDSSYGIDPVTNFGLLDALIAGRPDAVWNALAHLALPVSTLVIINAASMARLTAASAMVALEQDHIRFATALGVPRRKVDWYVVRSALPTFVSTSSLVYAGSLGGAVIVETIFGWAGLGQYGVDAILRSDYAALQGFVIVAGVFTAIVYALVEIAYRIVNPRARV